mmetsp:Transcript_2438/g.2726  ORF Transcript_2438/g.2726 Transcript_2438/m.2726 type:complete len:710 (-) Transcript_2438:149-2278(-)
MSKIERELDTAPSIFELFNSAKKLLSLQTRVENRQLRKDSYNLQKNQIMSFHNDHNNNENKFLDLLSPLSIDDLKNSPQYVQKQVRTNETRNGSITGSEGRRGNSNMQIDITPSSINDSPYNGNTDVKGTPWSNNKGPTIIKKEPTTTVSNVQISSSTLPVESNSDSTNNPMNRVPMAKPMPKSNLTSSLSQQKQEEKLGTQVNTSSSKDETKATECSNCHALKTPLWRKDPQGNTLCNACGLFLKLHGTTRPLSLKTDVIKKRSSRRSPATNKGMNPNATYTNSLSRQNITQDQFLGNRNIKNGFTIPITSQQNNCSTSANSTPSSANNGILSSSGGIPIGSSGSRYKNVLILPKPPLAPNTPNTPNTASNQTSLGAKSIPTPNSTFLNNDNNSPASPIISNSFSGLFNNNHNNNNNQAQAFKRKKAENGNEQFSANNESISRKIPSQMPQSSQTLKRNPSVSSSFQSSSFNKRTSFTSLSSLQRKNSSIGLSNSLSNININGNQNQIQNQNDSPAQTFNSSSFTGTNSLTPSNINILNLRFNQNNNGGYFDNSSFPHRNSNSGLAETPGSIASQSSFSSSHLHSNRQSFTAPSEFANFSTVKTPTELVPESLPSTTIPENDDMDTDDFFKNYTELHNNDNDNEVYDFDINNEKMGSRYEIKPTAFIKSSLTDGLKKQPHSDGQFPSLSQPDHQTNVAKDLDWLKFDL